MPRILKNRIISAVALSVLVIEVSFAKGQTTQYGGGGAQEPQPADVVQRLYSEIVMRHPLGVPYGAAKTAIWPLLSKRLINAFETRKACDLDWERRHRNADPPEKPPGFYEAGLFSGSNERGVINGAVVGSTKVQADGSYLVYSICGRILTWEIHRSAPAKYIGGGSPRV